MSQNAPRPGSTSTSPNSDRAAGGHAQQWGHPELIAEFSPGALATLPHDDAGQPLLKELPAGVRQVQAEAPRVWLAFERDAIAAHELVAWLGSRYALRNVTFQKPEIEDVMRRIYENGLLL